MAPEAFVRVLVDGIYNDPEHRAQKAGVGSLITVAGGWYVESLVQSGLVAHADKSLTWNPAHDWYEGKNMQGVGPHIQAKLPDRTPEPIDPSIIAELENDLSSLDAAFELLDGEVKTEEVPVETPEPPAPARLVPEKQVKPQTQTRKLEPESRGGRRRG